MSLQRRKQHGKEVPVRPEFARVHVASLDNLNKGDRIYILRVSNNTPDGYDAVLVRSGIYHGPAIKFRRPGQNWLDQDRFTPLALVLTDGTSDLARHSLEALGIGNQEDVICVTSLVGITFYDGRDFKQRQAFTPQDIAAHNPPE